MANSYLLTTSLIFFIINFYTNSYRELPHLFYEMSSLAGMTSILNHYYHNNYIRILDRTFISSYVVWMFLTLDNFELDENEKLLIYRTFGFGILSILTAIYLRHSFENYDNTRIKSTCCTIVHLFSHFALIYGYLYLSSKCIEKTPLPHSTPFSPGYPI